jgi:hypothetical protein
MSTATYREEHASQSEYFRVVSSVGVRGEAGGDPPKFLGLLAPNGSGAEAGLKEVCDLPGRALVQRGAQTRWDRGGSKMGLQPRQGGYRTLWYEVKLVEEDVP